MTDATEERFNKTLGPVSIHDVLRAERVVQDEQAREATRSSNPDPIIPLDASEYDKITNVLLVLVLKFGRAANVMVGVLIGVALVLVMLIWNVVVMYGAKDDFYREAAYNREQQKQTLLKANAAFDRAREAEAKANKAVEMVPAKVEEDSPK